jgi:CTP:molybdopterin cytidylyltransferase MocA
MRARSLEYPIILLAAGRASRMPVPKGLVDAFGRPWLERQLERIGECGGARAIIVLGHALELHAVAMPWIEKAIDGPIAFAGLWAEVVVNLAPDRGTFSSLQVGVARAGRDGAFVLPIDVPCPGTDVWQSLEAHRTPNVDACVPMVDGRGGHPVLCAPALLNEVSTLDARAPEARLDLLIAARAQQGRVARVAVSDPRARLNLNTPADWASLFETEPTRAPR